MIKYLKFIPFIGVFSILVFLNQSCERSAIIEANPFENNVNNQDTVNFEIKDIDPNSIAGLYQNIFKPTCANVGCHDGTFEPDFRTIESSYHSMVYRVPIKNDGSLTYRVDPGSPNTSAILNRMSGTIQPPMPIEIEPDGDWLEKEEEYMENVRNWIENGALDLAGNSPEPDVVKPSLVGAVAMFDGEVLGRQDGYGSIRIPDSVEVMELYLSFDTLNNPESFTNNELAFGNEIDGEFQEVISIEMEVMLNPIYQFGLYGTLTQFTHRAEIDLNGLQLLEDSYYMRARVQDGTQPITEIPANNGLYFIKEYMSFHRVN